MGSSRLGHQRVDFELWRCSGTRDCSSLATELPDQRKLPDQQSYQTNEAARPTKLANKRSCQTSKVARPAKLPDQRYCKTIPAEGAVSLPAFLYLRTAHSTTHSTQRTVWFPILGKNATRKQSAYSAGLELMPASMPSAVNWPCSSTSRAIEVAFSPSVERF